MKNMMPTFGYSNDNVHITTTSRCVRTDHRPRPEVENQAKITTSTPSGTFERPDFQFSPVRLLFCSVHLQPF